MTNKKNTIDEGFSEPLPFQSMLIVVRNQRDDIEGAIQNLLDIDYPDDCREIIVVDGQSEDGTKEKIEEIYSNWSHEVPLRVFENPGKILSTGWNIGIKNAKGDFVVRIDVHCRLSPDYVRICLNRFLELKEKGEPVAVVGGLRENIPGDGFWGETIYRALNSFFGTASPKYRTSNNPGWVKTVALGVYMRKIFEEIGYFNENAIKTQDKEFHARLRKAGYKLFLEPAAKATYKCRENIRKVAKQMYGYGKWNAIMFKKDREIVSLRHLAPGAFFMVTLLSFILTPFSMLPLGILLGGYLAGAVASALYSSRGNPKYFMAILLIFLCVHYSYGLGTFLWLFRRKNI